MASMFDIAGLLNPTALNRLLQPIQSPQGVQNFLANPQAAPQLPAPVDVPTQQVAAAPQVDPWAGMREQDVVSIDPMTTSAMPEQPKSFGQKYQDFINSDRGQFLNDVFTGWAAGSTPQESLAYGAKLSAGGRRDRQNVNQTVEWLKGKGLDDASARQIAGSPPALNEYLKSLMGGSSAKDNFITAGKSLYNVQTGEWVTPPAGAGGSDTEYGLNPQYGVDAQGNPVLIQLGKDGTTTSPALPEGVSLSKEPIKIDAGTHFILLDPITRQQIGQIPKENRQEAFDKGIGSAEGKAVGEANIQLPQTIASAENALKNIDAVINDPNLGTAVGIGGVLPAIPNTAQAGTVARIEQLQGQAFLQAFESLKGGGQITEVEGKKATDAIARLKRTQTKEDFTAALNDLRSIVQSGLDRARRRGGAPAAAEDPLGIR